MTKPARRPDQKSKMTVLLVDDHPIVRQGLKQLLEAEDDMIVCGEAETASEALRVAGETTPELALVDLSLKDGSGLELIKDLKIRHPQIGVLVLSMHDETVYAERALRAGALGYIMKEKAPSRVIHALRTIHKGEVYLSETMAATVLKRVAGGASTTSDQLVSALSDRELEVFDLIGQGLPTRDIAERLHLSAKTIETYRENIKKKLCLKNSSELLQQAIQWRQSESG